MFYCQVRAFVVIIMLRNYIKDNAKKIVEVDMAEKGTPLHEATVVGDTVGDPFKDTSSVAMNPIIKFTTLFCHNTKMALRSIQIHIL